MKVKFASYFGSQKLPRTRFMFVCVCVCAKVCVTVCECVGECVCLFENTVRELFIKLRTWKSREKQIS